MEFKTLYQDLVNSTEMIQALTNGIGQEQDQVKPGRGSWSILEVICHLYDEEREDFREHLDFILHRQDEKWKNIAPQAWVKLRKYNQQDFKKMKVKFFDERKKSLTWLKTLKNADWNKTYITKWGKFTAAQMFASWVAHDNLLIRQLTELRRARIENISKPLSIKYAGDW